LDLGCGTGANSVFLGQHGFDVTGVDFAPAALAKAARAAEAAGVKIDLVEDDLTALRRVSGPFDVLVDYGTLDDLSASDRDRYVRNVVPLARPGARFLLWCFQWPPRRLDRWLGFMPMAPGEVARRFGNEFTIEQLGGTERPAMRRFIPGYAAYLMTRHVHKEDQDS
jgi:SAM-dependent methyltransferase